MVVFQIGFCTLALLQLAKKADHNGYGYFQKDAMYKCNGYHSIPRCIPDNGQTDIHRGHPGNSDGSIFAEITCKKRCANQAGHFTYDIGKQSNCSQL